MLGGTLMGIIGNAALPPETVRGLFHIVAQVFQWLLQQGRLLPPFPRRVQGFMDRETWKFINTFAPWVSALGTTAAVIVSLYLALRTARVKIRVGSGIYQMLGLGQKVSAAAALGRPSAGLPQAA